MNIGWLKILGVKFYARSHSDAVTMKDGGTLTAKITGIISTIKEHHHTAGDINDFESSVSEIAAKADFAPKSHSKNDTTYGGASGSQYGHVRTAGNVASDKQYVIPFSTQFSAAQTTLNNSSMTYNGIYAVQFKGSATGAPEGLTAATTYYGTIMTQNYQPTSTVNGTYGVMQMLTIPKLGKLYCRFITGTAASAYGAWVDLTAIASGYA